MKTFKQVGFTMVELVAVIALSGVLAAIFSAKIVNPGGFQKAVAEEALLAVFRSAHQQAWGNSGLQVRISNSGSNVSVSPIDSGVIIATHNFSINEVAITAGSVGSGTTCGSISSTITLNFDSAGEIEAVDDDGFPICLNGESSLCISPAGFAHQGACL